MNPSCSGSFGGGGDNHLGDGCNIPLEERTRTETVKRNKRPRVITRRRTVREPYDLSPEAQSSQKRIRREIERKRSLHMAGTLMSVTSLTPSCGPELLLTKYQRLSQLVRYTAFLEDATSALVRELGVRLNFDFSPVTRYIRRLRYQSQVGSGVFDFPADEAEEVMKLLDTMSAGDQQQQQKQQTTTPSTRNHKSAASSSAAPPPAQPPLGDGSSLLGTFILPH